MKKNRDFQIKFHTTEVTLMQNLTHQDAVLRETAHQHFAQDFACVQIFTLLWSKFAPLEVLGNPRISELYVMATQCVARDVT